VVSGLVNRAYMKALGPELEGIVRDEAKKAEAKLLPWIERDAAPALWESHGGTIITLPPAEAKSYLATVSTATDAVLSTPQLKEDYNAFKAAGAKYRQ
jgi:C4-dicarboxylate-binding protein DctP